VNFTVELRINTVGEFAIAYDLIFSDTPEITEYSKFAKNKKFKGNFYRESRNLIIQQVLDIMHDIGVEVDDTDLFRRESSPTDPIYAMPGKGKNIGEHGEYWRDHWENRLRLFVIALDESTIILGDGGIKRTQTVQEDIEGLNKIQDRLIYANSLLNREFIRGNLKHGSQVGQHGLVDRAGNPISSYILTP
jgi:hypothetical protein